MRLGAPVGAQTDSRTVTTRQATGGPIVYHTFRLTRLKRKGPMTLRRKEARVRSTDRPAVYQIRVVGTKQVRIGQI